MRNQLISIVAGSGSVLVACIIVWLALALFVGGPTGTYHVDTYSRFPRKNNTPGLITSVYQDMRFRADRRIYVGPPANAWQLYFTLTQPQTPATQYKKADLSWPQ